jgi:ELWxxDGT repeat protein
MKSQVAFKKRLAFFIWKGGVKMRLGIKALYISIAIIQIIFLIVSTEAQADISLVKRVTVVPGGGPKDLTNLNGTLFFTADDGAHGRELWKSDGTEAGTFMVKDINPLTGSDPKYLTNVNGTLFFNAGHTGYGGGGLVEELWKSDGTEAGTVMVKDLNAGSPSRPRYLTNVNGTLFFTAYDNGDNELWKSDGTEAGTVMVKDINTKRESFPHDLANVNGTLYFSAVDGDLHGRELWKSDGTEAGTVMVKNINPDIGDVNSSTPQHLTPVGTLLFFTADDGSTGRELWRSDGTADGTTRVGDIWGGVVDSNPLWLTHYKLIVVFSADDGLSGRELWGSHLGLDTYLIKDIRTVFGYPELSSDPEYITVVGNTFFFAATAADGTARELWKSDGTEAGTVMVKDINPLTDSSPQNLADVNGTLYFSADDGEHGRELWKSDGTSFGTFMAKDINTFPDTGSNPGGFTDVNGTFYFVANARELWKIYENEESFPWELFVPAFIKKNRP